MKIYGRTTYNTIHDQREEVCRNEKCAKPILRLVDTIVVPCFVFYFTTNVVGLQSKGHGQEKTI